MYRISPAGFALVAKQLFIGLVAWLAWALPLHVLAGSEYRLAAGDVLKISVYPYQDLTTITRVTDEGNISFPFIGEVKVLGLNSIEAEMRIAELLRKGGFVKNPQVTVFAEDQRSPTVSVLGQVNRPGSYSLQEARTLVALLAQGQGTSATAADEAVLLRTSYKEGAKDTAQKVDLLSLLRKGDLALDVTLNAGDTLYVPRMDVFYIYGEVQRAGVYRLERDMTVLQALSVAGSLTPRGTEKGLMIKRRGKNGDLLTVQPQPMDLISPDDVLYVREALF